jgi:hypothetical protein
MQKNWLKLTEIDIAKFSQRILLIITCMQRREKWIYVTCRIKSKPVALPKILELELLIY